MIQQHVVNKEIPSNFIIVFIFRKSHRKKQIENLKEGKEQYNYQLRRLSSIIITVNFG
jgi:hypothetical protein